MQSPAVFRSGAVAGANGDTCLSLLPLFQGVDTERDMLVYSCEGLRVTPEVEAAVTAAMATWVTEAPLEATDPLAATPVAVPELVPAAVDPTTPVPLAVDPAGAAPGHHHHHHRHLLQAGSTATKEWASPWPFLVRGAAAKNNPKSHRSPACSCSATANTPGNLHPALRAPAAVWCA